MPQSNHLGVMIAKVFPAFGLYVGKVIEFRPDRGGDLWRVR